MVEIRLATRSSALAMAQASWVSQQLQAAHPDLSVDLVPVDTTGDVDRTSSLVQLSEIGAFVRAVQRAVLEDRADLAVHSLKDLPVTGPADLDAIYPIREEPSDVLCGSSLSDLEEGARVGTSSPRRAAQLRLLRTDLNPVDIRGNVDTRLGKVEAGEYDAVMLAEAGLARLGLTHRIDHRFATDEVVPAPGQAALAVEGVRQSHPLELAKALDHHFTRKAVEAERRLLEVTAAGCRSALGALVVVGNDGLMMTAFVEDEQGPRRASYAAATDEALVRGIRARLEI